MLVRAIWIAPCLMLPNLGLTAPALAADDLAPVAPATYAGPPPGTDLSVRLGVGAAYEPDYTGSDDYHVVPWPIVSLEFLRLPGIGEFGGPAGRFSIGPSFSIVGGRDGDDNPALEGLDDIDTAVELGAKAAFEAGMFGGFVALRHGFGGHEGWVGEAGLNVKAAPTPRLTILAGPRLSIADDEFFDTYYSVTPDEAVASGLPAYDASGGLRSAGLAAEMVYNLTDRVDLHMKAGWDRLVGDAADSPIVELAGSEDQFTIGAGVSYRLDLDLFD